LVRQCARILALVLIVPTGALAFYHKVDESPADSASAGDGIRVSGTEYQFSTGEMVVRAGEEVTITFTNAGRNSHNLAIPELDVTTKTIKSGKTATLTFTPETPGTYKFICSVPGHARSGMHGKLIVK